MSTERKYRARLDAVVRQIAPGRTSGGGSFLRQVSKAPPDAIFLTKALYKKDTNENKVNLGIGAYRTDEGLPYPLKVVRKVEKLLAHDSTLNHEYLPIVGYQPFRTASQHLMFGANHPKVKSGSITTVQTLSGTGSLRVGFEFISKFWPQGTKVYLSNPTWGNHKKIIREAGLVQASYRYWDPKTRGLDIDGMIADLESATPGSVVLLHVCAHNPTGVDPTREQWQRISKTMAKRGLFPYFDCAYQGFATGSLENDAYSVRSFAADGHELLLAQSYAKNMGLYGERVGALSVVCQNSEKADAVTSQLAAIIRPMYSNPPTHGAKVATTIATKPELFQEWKDELAEMSHRIIAMRAALVNELKKLGTPGDWSHITSQIGMFSFTGLTPSQVKVMIGKHHVYMLSSGRISMAGLNTGNVGYVAKAIDDVVRNVQ